MSMKNFGECLKRTYASGVFYTRKYSPEFCIAGGIATGVACAITTGIASTKVKDIAEQHKTRVEKVHQMAALDPEFDEKKALTKVYFGTAWKYTKLYMIPALLGATSISLVLGSHGIMKKRNTTLATALAVAEGQLEEYRKQVVEKFGEEVDKELSDNAIKKVAEAVSDDNKPYENETDTTYKGHSKWARYFGRGTIGWEDPEYSGPGCNIGYIDVLETSINSWLRYKRRLFMNEIYMYMHLPLVCEGDNWAIEWDDNGPDKQFHFCLRCKGNRDGQRFLNGEDDETWLDFPNVKYVRKDEVLASTQEMFERSRQLQEANSKEVRMYG